ncbi:MAG: RES domain-containing protein, partial [Chloroflexi bacterium]
ESILRALTPSDQLPVPDTPDPSFLDPLTYEVAVGTLLIRCHKLRHRPQDFVPCQGDGRFSPLVTQGKCVPTMYTASSLEGAVYETAFHDVPLTGLDRVVLMSDLRQFGLTVVQVRRNIRLAELRGPGLVRLGLERQQLIDTPATQYPRTRAWAQALYTAQNGIDGLIWTSRRDDRAEALILFDLDRIAPGMVVPAGPTLPLGLEPMLSRVYQMCEDSRILLVG